MSPRPLLIFMHLPKTAGTTLTNIIERQYGSDAVLPLYESTFGDELAHIPENRIDKICLILGHFYFGAHRCLSRPSTYMTMLRDPVERVISHYYYVQRDPSHYLHPVATKMSLGDYVIHCGSREPNNDQTRLLAGRELLSSSGDCIPEMLPRAKENLRDYFSVIGIAEEFDRSLILMKQTLGWGMPYYIRRNTTRRRPRSDRFPLDTIQLIQAYNQLDDELYRYGKAIFQEQVSLLGDSLEKEVHLFRVKNALLGRLLAGDIGHHHLFQRG